MLTWDDFVQHYQHTYFRVNLPHLKTKVVVFFDEIIKPGMFSANTKEYKYLNLRYDSSLAIDYKIPVVRMFEHDGMVLSFERLPVRQWSRGVCSKNSLIHNPIDYLGYPSASFDFDTIASAWNHLHTNNLTDALKKLSSPTQLGVTLTDNFWISEPLTMSKNKFLWYNSSYIGEINENSKEIQILFKPLLQEVIDYLRHTNQVEWRLG